MDGMCLTPDRRWIEVIALLLRYSQLVAFTRCAGGVRRTLAEDCTRPFSW